MWHALQLLIFLTVIKVPLIPTSFDTDVGTMISPRAVSSPILQSGNSSAFRRGHDGKTSPKPRSSSHQSVGSYRYKQDDSRLKTIIYPLFFSIP